MAVFKDALGQEWTVEFDAFLLDDVAKNAGVDLADLTAGGYSAIAADVKALVRVVAILCGEQLKAKRLDAAVFQKQIRKEAIERARKAVMNAAADFFPQSEWSEIQSALTKRQETRSLKASGEEFSEAWQTLGPILRAIETMPEEMRQGAMDEIQKQIREAGGTGMDLEKLQELASATGQAVTPSSVLSEPPESAESLPEE